MHFGFAATGVVGQPKQWQARSNDERGGDDKGSKASSTGHNQHNWAKREARRAGGPVHANDSAAPIVFRQLVDDGLAGRPQHRSRCA
jgi:hypothetical protein